MDVWAVVHMLSYFMAPGCVAWMLKETTGSLVDGRWRIWSLGSAVTRRQVTGELSITDKAVKQRVRFQAHGID